MTTVAQNDLITLNYGQHISRRVWTSLCNRFGFSADQKPEYISNGAEQTAYNFGDKYVLKLSNREFIIKTSKKLLRKKIPMVARCLAVVKANNLKSDKFYCIVQERCKPNKGQFNTNKFYKLSEMARKLQDQYPLEVLEAATRLNKLKIECVCDLHGENIMIDSNGFPVISDYGCLRF